MTNESDWVDIETNESDWVDLPDTASLSLRNEALGVGNRLMEGVGSLVSLGAAANTNLNPFAPGGPQVFGLNKNPINSFFEQKEEQAKAEGETLARQLLLYGDEKAKTAAGKIAEEIAFNAPGVLIPGGAVGSRVASAAASGVASGVTKAAGGDETSQAVASLVGGFAPATALQGVKRLTADPDASSRLLNRAMGATKTEFTQSARQFGMRGQTQSEIEKAYKQLIDDGIHEGSLDAESLFQRHQKQMFAYENEVGNLIDEADKLRKTEKLIPSFSNAEALLNSKQFAGLSSVEKKAARRTLEQFKKAFIEETDGSLRYAQNEKITLGRRTFGAGKEGDQALNEALYKDFQEFIENSVSRLVPDAKSAVADINRKLSAYKQTEKAFGVRAAGEAGESTLNRAKGLWRTSGGYGLPSLIAAAVGGAAGGLPGAAGGLAIPTLAAGAAEWLHSPAGLRRRAKAIEQLAEMGVNLPDGVGGAISTLSSTGARLDEADRKETGRDSQFSASASRSADEPEQQQGRSPARSALATDPEGRLDATGSNQRILSANPENDPSTTSQKSQRDGLSNSSATQTSEWEDLLRPSSLSRSAALDLFSRGEGMSEESSQNLDPLIAAVIQQESGGNPKARSEVGAVGLMQLMPATAKEIASELGYREYDLEDPETNRRFGTYYLEKLLRQFDGDVELALTAYHSGPGRVQKLLERTGGRTLADIIDLLGPVGQKYARSVLRRMERGVTQV